MENNVIQDTEHEKNPEFKINAMITNCDGYQGCRVMGVTSCGPCTLFEAKGQK